MKWKYEKEVELFGINTWEEEIWKLEINEWVFVLFVLAQIQREKLQWSSDCSLGVGFPQNALHSVFNTVQRSFLLTVQKYSSFSKNTRVFLLGQNWMVHKQDQRSFFWPGTKYSSFSQNTRVFWSDMEKLIFQFYFSSQVLILVNLNLIII